MSEFSLELRLLGLGFEEEERTAPEKKKEKRIERMSETGPFSFYVAYEPGRFKTDPFSFIHGR